MVVFKKILKILSILFIYVVIPFRHSYNIIETTLNKIRDNDAGGLFMITNSLSLAVAMFFLYFLIIAYYIAPIGGISQKNIYTTLAFIYLHMFVYYLIFYYF